MAFDQQTYDDVFKQKRRIIRKLRKLIKPLLYPGGYVDKSEPDGKLWLYAFRTKKHGTSLPIRIPKAIGRVHQFYGFTRRGIIEDAYAGGMLDGPFEGMPIEDLIRVLNIVEKKLADGTFQKYVPEATGEK